MKTHKFKPINISESLQLILGTVNLSLEPIDCYMMIRKKYRKTCESHSIRLTLSEFIAFSEFVASHWSFPTFETVPACFIEGDLQFTFYDNSSFLIMRRSTINHEKSINLDNKDLKSMELYFPELIFMMNIIQDPDIFPTNKHPLEDTLAFSKLIESEIKSLDEALPEELMIMSGQLPPEGMVDKKMAVLWSQSDELCKYFGKAFSLTFKAK